MSKRFVPLQIKQIIRETADASTLVMDPPADGSFAYKAGQYLTFKINAGGEELRRSYSLCSSPVTDSHLAVTVKKVTDGRASTWMNTQLTEGMTLEVFPPMGKFCIEPAADTQLHYVLIGGGSGITPLLSILKTALHAAPASKVTLLYGNRDENNIIFRNQLDALAQQYAGRLRTVHVLANPSDSWMGIKGMMDRKMILTLVQDVLSADALKKQFYLCGPAPMMEEVMAGLNFLGIAKGDIHRELFTAPVETEEDKPAAKQVSAAKVRGDYTVTVILDGKEHKVPVSSKKSILQSAIDFGVDPPFACQMGVCCTCRGKLHSGAVEMDEDEGLSDQEIEEGYVLTCQSHPLTPDVVVEYM